MPKQRTYANFGEYLYWSYANLQMLHYALNAGKAKYDRMCYMIRSKAFKAYLDSVETINNADARDLLKLTEKDRSKVSRLFAELVDEQEILQTVDSKPNNVKYRRVSKE